MQNPRPAVIIDQRSGLLVINLKTVSYRLLIVVGAPHELARPADVANSRLLRLREFVVIALAAFGAGVAPGDPLHQCLIVDPHLDDRIELEALVLEHPVKRLSLCFVAREPIQDEALLDVGLVQPLSDDRHYDVVGDEIATVHDRLGLLAHLGSRGDRAPQHVASRELLVAPFVLKQFRLGTLSGARRSEKYQIHRRAPLSFAFFYTSIMFNPKDTADNLKKYGGFIPGIRPGERTAEYIDYVLTRITVLGGLYLMLVCLLPEFMIGYAAVPFYFGGTSLLIVVSVTMDTVAQVQGHLLAQQYEGLVKKAKLRGARR